ncbi:MAG: hypothetical protein EOO89_04430 [Pedobacter sp.]|nr:MAG: hypothetical protein EOO89_04430 [Pedobacter sp.]
MFIRRSSILFLLIPLFFTAGAQQWEVGLNAGGAGYMGDLNLNNPLKISGINAGISVKRNIDSYFGIIFQYEHGRIKGNDASSGNAQFRDRNLSFKTSLNELSLGLEFNFLEYMSGVGRRRFSPYLFAGGGILFFQPTADYNGDTYDLSSFRTEGQTEPYKRISITIPYGFGIRYNLNENFNLFSRIGYRTAFTDYIDDVSGVYADPVAAGLSPIGTILSDRSGENTGSYLGKAGTQRGDFRKRDTYMFVGIGISYTFVSSKCY